MPTYDIILTTFNRVDYTKRTVASLFAAGALNTCERFIIVDNHSLEEGMKEFLDDMAQYQKVFILRRPTNNGWGTAVNDALGLSRAQHVLISNNDVEYKPGFMDTLFAAMHNARVGLVGVWRHTSHSFTGNDFGEFREMTDIPAVGWFLSKSAMEKVGMLPEKGACLTKGGNGEDTEYVQRMKAQGFLTGVTPEDVAVHIDGY